MPKLGVFSGGEACSILKGEGFTHVRTRGSHAVMQGADAEGASRTVPVPLHGTVKKGTLKSIISQMHGGPALPCPAVPVPRGHLTRVPAP